MNVERVNANRAISNRCTTNAGSMGTTFRVCGGKNDRQRTLVIRIAAITPASDAAITIARFPPSKVRRSVLESKSFGAISFCRGGTFCNLLLRKLLPATGVISALRPQSWRESRKMSSRGLSAPRPKKSKTESKKSHNRLFFNYFDSFSTPFSTFWAPGPRGPGNSFSALFPTLGPEGPNDPCSRARESQIF